MIGRLLLALIIVVACGAGIAGAQTPSAAAAPLTAADAQRVVDVLQDPQKRAELIRDLEAIAKAGPAPANPAASGSPPAASGSTPPKPAPALALAPHSLGAQILAGLSQRGDRLAGDAIEAFRTITAARGLLHWANGVAADPARRGAVLAAIWRAALVAGGALLFEWLTGRLVSRSVALLARHAPAGEPRGDASETASEAPTEPADEWRLLQRLPLALVRLGMDLVPIGVFWAAASLFAGLAEHELTRLTILAVVNAYAASRAIVAVGRMFASPDFDRLRLLHIDGRQAAWLVRWLRRITVVAVFGAAAIEVAGLFGLYPRAAATLGRLVALIVAIMSGIVVLRSRRAVRQRLRADGQARGVLARWRNAVAATWHYLALIAIAAAWVLWSAGAGSGLGGLRVLLGSIGIVIAGRFIAILALGVLDRAFRLSLGPTASARAAGAASRAARYHPAARVAVIALIAGGTAIMLLQFWGAGAFTWFRYGSIGARLASALTTVALAAIAAIIVWEGANARLERRLARLSAAGSASHAARLRTLLPILRAGLFVAVLMVVGLTALSEIGIDIAPLLAGAGIVGIAVGFGSQKLVQDVIGGMFVLFENAIQVGDWITVAGLSGTVEQLSVRNIWLRGGDGVVHIIPFSAVTSISNSNRGIGNAAVSLTVAYREDTERVFSALRDVCGGMRKEPEFAALMLGDLQLWVDAVKAWGVLISGTIACTDSGRWAVQHEFNRRVQQRFRADGIALSDWYGGAPVESA
ncbi:MAG TPA: mechanosensitive ion channel domain-containing protein [Stellaceae bacterium]|nr:mechanosensitive ion channel domain-containing protein [Stellaceae bacterium]